MRKLLFAFLALVIIGSVPGYWWYWNHQAENFKAMAAQFASSLNQKVAAAAPGVTFLRYDAIEAAGFPFTMTLVFKKPVIAFPVSLFLQRMRPVPTTLAQLASPPARTPDWVEEVAYGGDILLSGNITGSRFTLVSAGDRTQRSLINNVARHTLISSSATPAVCHLSVAQSSLMPWRIQPVFSDMDMFLSAFRAFDCVWSGMAIKDAANGTLLSSADAVSMSATKGEDGANRKVAFGLGYDNIKATPAFDTLMNDYVQIVRSAMGKPNVPGAGMIPLSEYGTQSAHMHAVYDGPSTKGGFDDPAAQIHFDVDKFSMQNALFNGQGEVHVASTTVGADRSASVALHSHSEVSERYDQLLLQQFTAILSSMQAESRIPGADPSLTLMFSQIGPAPDVAAAILPKFHPLGKIAFDLDASARGPNQLASFLKEGNVTLSALNWSSDHYGLGFKGNAKANAGAGGSRKPSGELVVTCTSCDALISDLGAYLIRVETVFDRTRPGKPPYITPALVDGIRQFLHAVAEGGPTAKDVVIDIVLKETGEMTVSGKPILEVMGLLSSAVVPHLPQAQPPSAPQGAPSAPVVVPNNR